MFRLRFRWIVVVLLGVAIPGTLVHADDERSQAKSPVLLRNVYVPKGNTSAWPTAAEKYVPISESRLAELLVAANATQPDQRLATVTRSLLYASMDSEGVLSGIGTLEVQSRTDQVSWLPLVPGTTSVIEASWREAEEQAKVGFWGQERGLGIQVPADGRLDFGWRHTAPTAQAAAEYHLSMPAALSTVLYLDLPPGQTPEPLAASGTLVSEAQQQPVAQPEEEQLRNLPAVPPDKVRWRLTCGPQQQLAWRLRAEEESTEPEVPTASVDEQLHITVAENGLQLEQRFELKSKVPLTQPLTVSVPSQLVIRSARWDGHALEISRTTAGEYQIEIPQDANGSDVAHHLAFEAWHPTRFDENWALPQISVSGVDWTSGQVRVELAKSLKLADLRLRSAVQIMPEDGASGDALHFAKLTPTGRVELQLQRRPRQFDMRVGRVVELNSTGSSATVYTQIESPAPSSVLVLTARLEQQWQPQSVTASAPYKIDDWYVSDGEGNPRRLTVRVSTDLADETKLGSTPVKLEVEATRSVSARTEWLPIRESVVLNWDGARLKENLLTFEHEDGYQIEFNPKPPALPEDIVMPHIGTLLPATVRGDVYDLSEIRSDVRSYLTAAAAEFDVTAVTTVMDGVDHWQVVHRLECSPDTGSVGELRVATRASIERLRFRLEDQGQWRSAERVTIAGEPAEDAEATTVWLLELSQRQSDDFVVRFEEQIVADDACSVASLSVRNASEQTSRVEVRSPRARHLKIAADGWRLTSDAAQSAENAIPLHSTWLAASDDVSRTLLVERAGQAAALPRASVELAALRSVYLPESRAQHRYQFTIASHGESRLRCELPEYATEICWQKTTGDSDSGKLVRVDSNAFTLPLDDDAPSSTFVIEFQTTDQLSHAQRYAPPWPTLGVPVTSSVWTIAYPGDYRVSNPLVATDAATWKQRLFGVLAPAHGAPVTDSVAIEVGVLDEVRLPGAGQQTTTATFIHDPTTRARRGLVLVGALAIGFWLWQWPGRLVIATVVAAVAALLLPDAVYPWATAAWGGLVLAVAVRTLQAAARSARRLLDEPLEPSLSAPTAGVLLAIATLIGPASALAADDKPTIESILIPVDSSGREASDQRYLTPRLLAELLRREQLAAAQDGWLISSARYSGAFASDSGTLRLASTDWQWEFDLQAFHNNATVDLPIRKADAAWDEAIFLDGLPQPLQWNEDGQGCTFRVRRAGKYRARLAFRPTTSFTEEYAAIELQVPPLPRAQLVLDVPGDPEGLQVQRRTLPARSSSTTSRVVALDMRPELSLRWPQHSPAQRSADWHVDQWEWLHCTKDSVIVDGVLYLSGPTNELPALALVSDREARRVAPTEQSTSAADHTDSQPQNRWTLDAEPLSTEEESGEFVARFRLVIDRSHPFGQMRLPQLQLEGFDINSRQFAVTHDDDVSIVVEDALPEDIDDIDAGFANHWPQRALPEFFYNTGEGAPPPVISIRPVRAAPVPDESLALCCFPDRIEAIYQGDYPATGDPQFRQAFDIDPNLHVDSVRMTAAGETVPVSFSTPEPGRLAVIFDRPATGAYELRITGWLPSGSGGAQHIPRITTSRGTPPVQRVSLFASPEVSVTMSHDNVQPLVVESRIETPRQWSAYGVGSYLIAPQGVAHLEFEVADNNPAYEAALLSTMLRRDGTWISEIGLAIDVTRDTLPEIVLHWPDELTGTPEVDSNASVTVERSGEPEVRKLRVRFSRALVEGDTTRLTIRSAVRPATLHEVVHPRVDLEGASSVERYFALPFIAQGNWTVQEAEPTGAPRSIRPFLAAWPEAPVYRSSTDGRAQVRWIASSSPEQAPALPLAMVDAKILPEGADQFRTRFALPALNVGSCEIHVPSEQRLVFAKVDGRAAVTNVDASGRYHLFLPDSNLPHQVELVTESVDTAGSRASVQLQAPGLRINDTPLPAEHRLWTVRHLRAGVRFSSAVEDQLQPVDRAALALNQLLRAATSDGQDRVSDRGQQRSAAWAAAWFDTLAEAEGRLRQQVAMLPPASPEIVDAADPNAEYGELLTRAAATIAKFREVMSGPDQQRGAIVRFHESHELPAEPGFTFVQSTSEPLHLTAIASGSADAELRWTLAAATVVAAAVWLGVRDRFQVQMPIYEMLFPIAILVGLVWWLCLWPALVGLAIAMAGAVAWLRWIRYRN